MAVDDTIFALASGAGVAGVAVLRLSGDRAIEALKSLSSQGEFQPRVAKLVTLRDPETGNRLDKALALVFKSPASFTGEDVVELHVHGGHAVIQGVLESLSLIEGLRFAEPGEFSRRAFDNGKMDLTEAEGLNDLIHAQTAAQKRLALRQMDGSLRALYEDWRHRLTRHLAHLEADIDFPDEDLPEGVAGQVRPEIAGLCADIADHLADGKRGQALRDGYRIVILGEPNAGKSTLLNALAKSDVAIVSDEAGTTRDVLETRLDLGGFPVMLIDTAGIRSGGGSIEQEGIRRALSRAGDAHLKLVLTRADDWPTVAEESEKLIDAQTVLLITQTDRAPMFHVEHPLIHPKAKTVCAVSVRDNIGIEQLLGLIAGYVEEDMALNETPVLTRVRHRRALEEVIDHLTRFDSSANFDPVLAAEDIRMAARALGSITGLIGVEDVLDMVFSDFCIGK